MRIATETSHVAAGTLGGFTETSHEKPAKSSKSGEFGLKRSGFLGNPEKTCSFDHFLLLLSTFEVFLYDFRQKLPKSVKKSQK